MSSYWILIAILLPIIGGVLISLIKWPNRKIKNIYTEVVVFITSIIVFLILLNRPNDIFVLFSFTGNMTVAFKLDGLGSIFAAIVAFLWPLCTLYAFEYMTKEEHENIFFTFYTITYGITLGIASASDILTLYVFYEMLTLVTMPLIMHTLSREAILATRTYLVYSIGGAAFAFMGMVFIITFAQNPRFTYGGVLTPDMIPWDINVFLLLYVMTFMGFGVKAAVWPLSKWLPLAGVAPTPVTGLLHAVAVVNSGAFAMMRLTYYCYNPEYIANSWAQYFTMAIASITIVYGCSKAVKERHLKRRLANSTVGNLSYMVFGVALMSPLGLAGALMHFVCHSFMKIASFFCAGAIIHKSERHYVYELNGMAKKMPKVYAVFTVSALALMGVPLLAGFVSKYALAKAAINSNMILGYIGLGALLISALLTAIYMMTIVVRAYFPAAVEEAEAQSDIVKALDGSMTESDPEALDFNNRYETIVARIKKHEEVPEEEITDPSWQMLVPLAIFTVVIIMLGVYCKPVWNYVYNVALGVIK